MRYHFDHEVRLVQTSDRTGLYAWSLVEFSPEGKALTADLIPWAWSLFFTASELRYRRAFELTSETSEDNDAGVSIKPEDSESITAILHPGLCRDGKQMESEVSYSMYGTRRRISDFSLQVHRLAEDSATEGCRLWGGVSYTADFDFRDETVDDSIEVHLSLIPRRFDELARLVRDGALDVVTVRIKGASGLYSDWSPSISTTRVKVLTEGEEHQVILPEGCETVPPRLGHVGELSVSLMRRAHLNLKQDFQPVVLDKVFEVPEPFDEDDQDKFASQTAAESNELLLNQAAHTRLSVESLRTPLWAIVALLIFLVALRLL